jgi:hypothetical protein
MLNLALDDFSAVLSRSGKLGFDKRRDFRKRQQAIGRILPKRSMSLLMLLVFAGAPLQAQRSGLQESARQGDELAASIAAADVATTIEGISQAPLANTSAVFGLSCLTPKHCFSSSTAPLQPIDSDVDPDRDQPGDSSKAPAVVALRKPKPPGINESVFYKNRLEFSLDSGWLPINIPFVFDVFMGDAYTMTSLKYTLVPVIASLRWQLDDVDGPWIFRGNWDLETSAGFTFIPRGPETRYISWIMGIRRNFVPRRGRVAPYFDGRLGLGDINAKEPSGVLYAQGQNFTFTVNMGSGVRYNFNSRYSISAGLNWMHISNLYLSEPQFSNYGINVYGPMFGIDVRLGKPRLHSSQ